MSMMRISKRCFGRSGFIPLLVLLCLALAVAGCASGGKVAPAVAAPGPADALVGRWSGSTHINDDWTQVRSLAVLLEIAPDGSVGGKVGDAELKDGVLGTTNPLGFIFSVPESSHGKPPASLSADDHFQVTARLNGPLIAAEQLSRPGVMIVFYITADGTLRGGLASTGNEFGDKKLRKLSTGGMLLRKQT